MSAIRGAEVARSDPGWMSTVDGIADRLAGGATVADLGCGTGRWTVGLARAFRHSSFMGVDEDAGRIAVARALAVRAGVHRRTRFEVGTATDLCSSGYDLVTLLDRRAVRSLTPEGARCLHASLVVDGRLLAVTPIAAAPTDRERIAGLLQDAGFRYLRVATRTSVDLVLEARP
jgi:SAM-dependent methyltransferase